MFRVAWFYSIKMITISIVLIFLGCFILFNTSKKVLLQQHFFIEKWVQNNIKLAKAIGITILIISSGLFNIQFGLTSGIFVWLLAILVVMSSLIIFYPLKIMSYKHVVFISMLSFLLELIVL